ncbi:MAG: alpha/beta fold hydrolase [Xanthomonadales bacterium]|nr:alpha/beta fold hydrolase [Xanthomonadales bacterium]
MREAYESEPEDPERFSAFCPPHGLRSGHVQSLLNSSRLRKRLVTRRAAALLDAQEAWILDGGDGIRLQGLLSAQRRDSRGLAVLLHGWEGSANSNYMLGSGARLFDAGFDVFRLNFRDHGGTQHLNEGIFHSCRLDEVVHALSDMQHRLRAERWFLAGYSLGGNFSLRVALQAQVAGLRVARVVAVCPVISPANAMLAMERGLGVYQRYFERKWSRSLRIKQQCFADLYGAEDFLRIRGLRERTDYLATRHAGFASAEQYFEGYSIAGRKLESLRVPSTLLTAADDPVVPIADFAALPENPALEVIISRYGGHCGFLKNWRLESLAEDLIVDRVLAAAAEPATRDHVLEAVASALAADPADAG